MPTLSQKLISALTAAVFASYVFTFLSFASQACQDSLLTFDEGTLDCLTSGGSWQLDSRYISRQNSDIVTVADTDEAHGYALKLLRHGNYPIPITHTLGFDGEQPLIAEFSYKEDNFGQPRVWIDVSDASGEKTTMKVIEYTGSAEWNFGFCSTTGDAVTYTDTMPKADTWRRVRLIFDLADDSITMSHWSENAPESIVTYAADGVLSDFESIDSFQLRSYTRSGDGDAIYLDDIHIYTCSALTSTGFNIQQNACGVSTRATHELRFNAPLAPMSEQELTVSIDGVDSVGNKLIDSDCTLTLGGSGSSIAVRLSKRMMPYSTYSITVSGTVYDLWHNAAEVDETVCFTTGSLSTGGLQLAKCIFSQNGTETETIDSLSPGALEAEVMLTADSGQETAFWSAIGVYDEDNTLAAIDIHEQTTASGSFALSVQVPDDGKRYSARLYVWQSGEAPQPYRAFITGGTNMKQSYSSARATDISEVISVTDAQVEARMKDVILMTPTSSKALVNNTAVSIDTSDPTFTPEVRGGLPVVPIGFLVRAFGGSADYADGTMTVQISGTCASLKNGTASYTAAGASYSAELAAEEKNSDLLVPLSVVENVLGTQAFYDDGGYIIIGKDAKSFNLSNKTDKKILDAAISAVIFDNPTAADIVTALKEKSPNKAHPRLMITDDTLKDLKDKISGDPTAAKWYADFLTNCNENYLNADLLEYELIGVRLLVVSRKALERISNLSFAYLIEGKDEYAYKAIDEMINVCTNFPDWNQKHFLDVAEMAAAVALGYDWCYDKLTASQKEIICGALIEKGFKYGLMQLRGEEYPTTSGLWTNSSQPTYPGNWVSVCSGGLTMAALAVGDETAELEEIAGEIVSSCIPHLQKLVAKFAPDGAWKEGPTYWRYSYKYFAYNFDSMRTALGTDYGLSKAPGLHKGAYFMIAMTGSVANFDLANSEAEALSCPQFMWLSNRYGDAALARYRKWFLENFGNRADFTDIIWYNPSYDGDISGIPTETNSREFPIAVTRSGYGIDRFYVAFHGADDGGGRIVDLDCGQYIIDLFGTRWATDMGSEGQMYVSHADEGIYLSDYYYYRMRAEAHNTVVVNPGYYEDQNYSALKDIEHFEYNNRYTLMSSDFTDVYAFKGVELFKRSILVDKVSMSTTVYDKVKMSVPSEFYSFVHVGGDVQIASDGKSAVISKGSNKMLVKLVGTNDFKLGKMPAVALDTSPQQIYGADDSARRKLYIKADHITDAEYALCITPLCGAESQPAIVPVEDLSAFTVAASEHVPTLSALSVGGEPIANFSADSRIYTLNYADYVGTDKASDISVVDIAAEGDDGAEVRIEQPREDNRCARITVSDGKATGYYFINFEA